MVSMWNNLFLSFPCKRTSSGFPYVSEFTVILLLLSLFQSNLPQILLSFNCIILCPGFQIALHLITFFLPTFPTSSYTILLFVHFITANWSHRASLATGLSYWPLTCHFLSLKSLPFILSRSVSSGIQFECHLSREAFCVYTGVPYPSLRPPCSFILQHIWKYVIFTLFPCFIGLY